jgi:hypothetical protein
VTPAAREWAADPSWRSKDASGRGAAGHRESRRRETRRTHRFVLLPPCRACTFAVEYAHPGSGGDLQNTVTATIKSTTAPFEEVGVMGSTTINVDLNVGP